MPEARFYPELPVNDMGDLVLITVSFPLLSPDGTPKLGTDGRQAYQRRRVTLGNLRSDSRQRIAAIDARVMDLASGTISSLDVMAERLTAMGIKVGTAVDAAGAAETIARGIGAALADLTGQVDANAKSAADAVKVAGDAISAASAAAEVAGEAKRSAATANDNATAAAGVAANASKTAGEAKAAADDAKASTAALAKRVDALEKVKPIITGSDALKGGIRVASSFTISAGLKVAGTFKATMPVAGVKKGDNVNANPVSVLPDGVLIGTASCAADGVVTVPYVIPVALTLAALTVQMDVVIFQANA